MNSKSSWKNFTAHFLLVSLLLNSYCVHLLLLNDVPPEGGAHLAQSDSASVKKNREKRDGGGYGGGYNPMMMMLPYLMMQQSAAARQDTPGAAASPAVNPALLMSLLGYVVIPVDIKISITQIKHITENNHSKNTNYT